MSNFTGGPLPNWRSNNSMYFKPDGTPRTNFASQFTPSNASQNPITPNVGNNAGMVINEQTGRTQGANAPEGFMRGLYGFTDLFTGRDDDQRGHSGGRVSDKGYGEIGKGYKKDEISGDVIKDVPKEESFVDSYLKKITSDEYLDKQEERADRMANKKMWREMIGKNLGNLGSTLAAGQWAVAEANRGIAEQATRAGAHLPNMAAAVQPYQPRGRTSYYGGGSQKKALGS
jgi:hypothetical protein